MEHDPELFRPPDLGREERRILADYWRSRGVGEMGAARYFRRQIADLSALDAPGALIDLATRAQSDEERHGLWGRDWAVFFGHPDDSPPVATRTRELIFPGASPAQNRVLRVVFCALLETCGCHVLSDVRPRIFYEPLRDNNRQHLADEVQHARVGWGMLAVLEERHRDTVRNYLPLLLSLLPQAVCDGPEQDELDHLVPWGYLTPSVLRAGHERALREVILPGLQHLDLLDAAALHAAALSGAAPDSAALGAVRSCEKGRAA